MLSIVLSCVPSLILLFLFIMYSNLVLFEKVYLCKRKRNFLFTAHLVLRTLSRGFFNISFSGLNCVTCLWNRSILCAIATVASFSKRLAGSPFHINWWFYSWGNRGIMRVRVKTAHNYATIVKMREFRLRGCNRPHIVATTGAVDSVVAVALCCASDTCAMRAIDFRVIIDFESSEYFCAFHR